MIGPSHTSECDMRTRHIRRVEGCSRHKVSSQFTVENTQLALRISHGGIAAFGQVHIRYTTSPTIGRCLTISVAQRASQASNACIDIRVPNSVDFLYIILPGTTFVLP